MMMRPVSGDGKPPYSFPVIVAWTSTSAPAPRMLPVRWNPGSGMGVALNVTVGAADVLDANASTDRTSKTGRIAALSTDQPAPWSTCRGSTVFAHSVAMRRAGHALVPSGGLCAAGAAAVI